jgi:hypothetical protein
MGLVPLALFTKEKTGIVESVIDEMEVKVGVPRF